MANNMLKVVVTYSCYWHRDVESIIIVNFAILPTLPCSFACFKIPLCSFDLNTNQQRLLLGALLVNSPLMAHYLLHEICYT